MTLLQFIVKFTLDRLFCWGFDRNGTVHGSGTVKFYINPSPDPIMLGWEISTQS